MSSKTRQRAGRFALVLSVICAALTASSQASAQATLVAHYAFDDCDWEANSLAVDSVGSYDGSVSSDVNRNEDATSGLKPNTCSSAEFTGGTISITGLPVSTAFRAQTTVSFWMYWDGTNSVMPIGWGYHDLWLVNGSFGFNTWSNDVYGISSSGLANSWHHVTVVFNNNDVQRNRMYIDGVRQTLSQRQGSPTNSRAVVSSSLRISGTSVSSGYRFRGKLDEVKVYDDQVSQSQVNADVGYTASSCPSCGGPAGPGGTKVAKYTFDDDWSSSGSLADSVGSADGSRTGSVTRVSSAASGSKPDTCFAGDFGGGAFDIYGLPISTASSAQTSVTFWMYWDGTNSVMPMGFRYHDLWFYGGSFGFNSGRGDIRGIASSGLASSWHHVAVVFNNYVPSRNKMYIDGVLQSLTQRRSSPSSSNSVVSTQMRIGGWWGTSGYRFRGQLDEFNVYTGELSAAQVLDDMQAGCDSQVAWFQMEEASWNGTSGEVVDASGNDHHATATNLANTGDEEPALVGDPGTCSYADLDGADDYLAVPSSFPDLSGDFSIATWIKPSRVSGGARIFADDENNTGGFALSLGDGGDGELRFFSRAVSPVSVDTTGTGLSVDTWYHVVAVHNSSAKTRQIYVNGVAQTLTGGVTAPIYTGTWGTDSGPASIGGETNSSSENSASYYFEGFVDEVKAYDSALNSSEVSALYSETHACSSAGSLDHFEIDIGSSSASTCVAKTVTITACATNGCGTLLTSYSGTVDLTTSTSHGSWSKSSALGTLSPDPDTDDNGSASYTFSASDNGVAVLGLTDPHAEDVLVTANDASAGISSGSSTIQFRDNAFVVAEDPLQIAGRSQTMSATLWQRDGSDCAIATGYAGSKPLKLWLSRDVNDPGGIAPTVGGTSVPNSASTSFSLTFSAGVSSFVFDTTDVGKYVFNLRDDSRTFAPDVDIESDAVTLTTRPFGLDVRAQTTTGDANPQASNSSGAVFEASGVAFVVSARAVLWQSADDTNGDGIPDGHGDSIASNNADLTNNSAAPAFGNETAAESVALTAYLVAPSSGNDPGISGSSIASFSAGSGSVNDVVFGEVGIIEIKAALADNSYLGAGDAIGASGYVGRFVPDHFELSGVLLSDRQDSATQTGCVSAFTYLDEDLELEFDVAAKNAVNTTTQNYTGSFAKLNNLSSLGNGTGVLTNALNLVGSLGANVYTPADRLSGTTPSITMVNGSTSSSSSLNFKMARLNSGGLQPEAPLSGIEFGFNPTDSDGVEGNGTLMITMPSGAENFTSAGTTTLYFGRIFVENAHGSELESIKVWAHTEYCAAVDATPTCTQWTDLSASVASDSCTKLSFGAPSDTSVDDYWLVGTTYAVGSEVLFRPFDLTINRGGGGVRMSYTGSGNGLQELIPDLGSNTVETFHDYLLLQQGTVTFGIYRGNDNIIYMREAY